MLGDITIAGGEQGKGRSFQGSMLAYITCSAVTFGVGELRPIWACIATDAGSAKPMLANLRLGRPAAFGGKVLRFLPKLRYRFDQQQAPEGALFSIYLPDFFQFDASADDDSLTFVVLVEKQRVQDFAWDKKSAVAWLRKLRRVLPDDVLDLVPFFAAYLDRRCKLPLPASLNFQAQLLAGLLDYGGAIASIDGGFEQGRYCRASGMADLGLHRPIYFQMGHESFSEFCAEEVGLYVRTGGVL